MGCTVCDVHPDGACLLFCNFNCHYKNGPLWLCMGHAEGRWLEWFCEMV